jgi:hypothetical protein
VLVRDCLWEIMWHFMVFLYGCNPVACSILGGFIWRSASQGIARLLLHPRTYNRIHKRPSRRLWVSG